MKMILTILGTWLRYKGIRYAGMASIRGSYEEKVPESLKGKH